MQPQAVGVELALDLCMDGVTLLSRGPASPWESQGCVQLDDPGYAARMTELRARAEALGGPGVRVRLWLPEDQVLVRSLILRGETLAERHASALSALLAMTPYRSPDIVFDMAEDGLSGRTTVVAATRTTLAEAGSFAEAHGFRVGFVSTAAPAPGFTDGPRLTTAVAAIRPGTQPGLRAGVLAASLAGLVVLAGVGGYLLLPANPPATPEAEGVAAALLAAVDPGADENASPFAARVEEAERPAALRSGAEPVLLPPPELSVSVLEKPVLPADEKPTGPEFTLATYQPAAPVPLPASGRTRTDLPVGVESTATEGTRYQRNAWTGLDAPETLELANVEQAAAPPPRPGSTTEVEVGRPRARPVLAPPTDLPHLPGPGAPDILPQAALPPAPATATAPAPATAPAVVAPAPGTPVTAPPPAQDPAAAPDEAVRPDLSDGPPTRFAPMTAEPPAAAQRRTPATTAPTVAPGEPETGDLAASGIAPMTARPPQRRPASAQDLQPQEEAPTSRAIRTAQRAKPRPEDLGLRVASLQRKDARPAIPPSPAAPTPAAPTPAVREPDPPVAAPTITIRRPPPTTKPEAAKPDASVPDTELPEDVKPVTVPSNVSIRRAATDENAIDLSVVNLMGIYGSPRSRRALVRLPSGVFVRVTRGDKVEGWSVSAISENTVRLARGSATKTLTLPKN